MTWDCYAPPPIADATFVDQSTQINSNQLVGRNSLRSMYGLVVLALGFRTGNANDSGKAVFLNDLVIKAPIHSTSRNLDLIIIMIHRDSFGL